MAGDAPYYDPPYDSPIEGIFAWNLTKYLRDDVEFKKQYKVSTEYGNFYLDFIVRIDGRYIGFECDGKEFHKDSLRDEFRDAFILSTQNIEKIYRFKGKDIYFKIEEILYCISLLEPELFSKRGKNNLRRLSNLADEERELCYNTTYIVIPSINISFEMKTNLFLNKRIQDLLEYARNSNLSSIDAICNKHISELY